MEEYAVLQVSNGNHSIVGEHITSPDSAKVNYHTACAALWNEPTVITGSVMIVDSCNRLYNGYHEIITHPAPTQKSNSTAQTPAQTETPTQGQGN